MIRGLHWKSKERFITPANNSISNISTKKKTTKTRKQKWKKQLYRYFKQQTSDIAHQTSTWLRKGNLKRKSVQLLLKIKCATTIEHMYKFYVKRQDNAIETIIFGLIYKMLLSYCPCVWYRIWYCVPFSRHARISSTPKTKLRCIVANWELFRNGNNVFVCCFINKLCWRR